MKNRTGVATGQRGIQRLPKDRAGRTRWRLRVQYKCPTTGLYKDVEKRIVAERLRDAISARHDWIRALEAMPGTPEAPEMTVAEVIKKYRDAHTKKWKPSSAKNARVMLGYFADEIGQMKASEVSPQLVKQILNKKTLKPRSHNSYLGQLLSCFRWSFTEGLISTNRLAGMKKEKKDTIYTETNPGHLLVDDVGRYLAFIKENEKPYYPVCLFGISTGIRSGSLRVLKRTDLRDSKVFVSRGLSAGQIVKGTKTHAEEVIPIPGMVYDFVCEWWETLPEWRKKQGWLFPGESGGIMSEEALARVIKKAWQTLGLPKMTIHGMRRTAAHLMSAAGVPVQVAQTIMGHETASQTIGYSSPEEKQRREAVEKAFGALLGSEG